MTGNSQDLVWLRGDGDLEVLGRRLERIRESVKPSLNHRAPNQCAHDFDHCMNIEYAIHHLIPFDTYEKFSPKERFTLLASPWVMNYAWNEPRSRKKPSRLSDDYCYQRASQRLEEDQHRALLGLNEEEARIFRFMITYHPLNKDLQICPETLPDGPNQIRVRLLTAYLRLADAIHVDDAKGPTSLFYFLEDPSSLELFHWLKRRLQLIISPKLNQFSIEVELTHQMSASEPLIKTIETTLELCVNSVKNTLVRGQIANYLSVIIHATEGPPLPPDRKIELEKLMKEFALSFPPNAGTLQKLFLSSMREVVQRNFVGDADAFREIQQLFDIAKEAKDFRPCHLGLEHHIKECEEIMTDKHTDISGKRKRIEDWANAQLEERRKRLEEVFKNGAQELGTYTHFLVFGFSSTVIGTLKKLHKESSKNKPGVSIYVCEAHNKSRFDPAKRLIYVDGVNYAVQLKQALPKAKIIIMPDITAATVLKRRQKGDENWALLFGANGVTRQAECGHSAGHLSLAIIASYAEVPVYVLCDSKKIGSLKPDRGTEREDQWLKGVPEWQWPSVSSLEFMNLRESVIEPDLIRKIITENGAFTQEEFKRHYKKQEQS